jgi:flagellar hook assembly protein FlgD
VVPPASRTHLEANVPNPFNPSTRIRYHLATRAQLSLHVYDVAGLRVRTLVETVQPAGTYVVVWDGTDDAGRRLSAGVYICRFESNPLERRDEAPVTQVRKLVFLP